MLELKLYYDDVIGFRYIDLYKYYKGLDNRDKIENILNNKIDKKYDKEDINEGIIGYVWIPYEIDFQNGYTATNIHLTI